MYIGLWRSCIAGSPRSMIEDSMIQANAGLSCFHVSTSKLSSARMEFCVGTRLPFTIIPLLILSTIS